MRKQASLYAPRNWPIWFTFGLLRLCILLPYPAIMSLGRSIGRLIKKMVGRRTKIARINLDLCFPELSNPERSRLLLGHFESLGMGLMEFGLTWWGSDKQIFSRLKVTGREHIAAALSQDKGIILMTGHFTSIELAGRIIHQYIPIHPVYRPHENPVVQHFIAGGRERIVGVGGGIPREDVRSIIRCLRNKQTVWLATDQNYGHKGRVFSRFFGVPAATNSSITRLAKMTGAVVLPAVVLRQKDHLGHELLIESPLTPYPTGDLQQDVQAINDVIESWTRKAPEQYNWIHRRFKTRPKGEKRFYDGL